MGPAVVITRQDLTAEALRQHAGRWRDGRVACRALAMAHILDGATRAPAAAACGMDRQTLRDWVHRYNANGLAGLRDAPRSGRPAVLSTEQIAELKALVVAGTDLAKDGVVRWRCLDLRSVIETRFQVTIHERTIGKLLRRLGLTRLQPRPLHPKQDLEAQAAFKKNFAERVAEVLPPTAAGKPIEIWFQDEARVGHLRRCSAGRLDQQCRKERDGLAPFPGRQPPWCG